MAEPQTTQEHEPAPPDAARGSPRRLRIMLTFTLVGIVVALIAVLAAGFSTRQGSSGVIAPSPSGAASVVQAATPNASSATPNASSATPNASSAMPSGASGPALIAAVDDSGALTTMNETGGSVVSYTVPGVVFGSPTWSPDGSRIAAIGSASDGTSIYVFPVRRGGPVGNAHPIVIYRSSDQPPFYLYWAPDSRKLAFLASEPVGLSLRIAPADGSAPLDGSGPGAIIRRGAPLYFDWVSADRLLLHVGSGASGFVGEVAVDGAAIAPAVAGTGDFRAASVSRDGQYLAYVRSEAGLAGEIVVASQAGASEHDLAVFGASAFVFDPTGDTLAS